GAAACRAATDETPENRAAMRSASRLRLRTAPAPLIDELGVEVEGATRDAVPAEVTLDTRTRLACHGRALPGIGHEGVDGSGHVARERLRVTRLDVDGCPRLDRHEQSGPAVVHDFRNPADRRGDDGRAAG